MASNLDFTLRRNNGTDTDVLYPTTRWTQIDEKPTTFTPTAHSHGNISDGGAISSAVVTPASGDFLLLADASNSGKVEKGITLGAGTTTFLRNDGTWATPADSTTLTGLGITATAAELNHVDGVTSSIQTQIDNKIGLKSNTDNRAVATVPNDYNAKFEIKGLKQNTTIGLTGGGTYSGVLGIRGWTDSSGGNSHELAFDGNGGLYHRNGATTTWSPWARMFTDDYHPNADTLTTARNIALSGDVTGSASFNGSAGISITATVADDSHNHIISNIDGLQTALDGKSATTHLHTGVYEPANANIQSTVSSFGSHLVASNPHGITAAGISAMSTSHAANAITGTNISNWNTAYGWGGHSGLYRPIAWVPAWTDVTSKPTTFAPIIGSGAADAVAGNDARLTDSRTPTSHTHGNITNAGYIGTTASLPIITGAGGILQVGSFGTTAGTFAAGNHTHSYLALTGGTLTGNLTLDKIASTTTSSSRSLVLTARAASSDFTRELYVDYLGKLKYGSGASFYDLIDSSTIGSQTVALATNAYGLTPDGDDITVDMQDYSMVFTNVDQFTVNGASMVKQVKKLASDTASTSTTQANPSGMSASLVAGHSYRVTFFGKFVTGVTTTGATFGFDTTATVSTQGVLRIMNSSTGSFSAEIQQSWDVTSTKGTARSYVTATGVTTAYVPQTMQAEAIMNCTASGTLYLGFATEVASSSATLMAGATMIVEQIS